MGDEYYKKHRPKSWDDVVGQPVAVKTIRGLKRIPQTILMQGASGCGKTTAARILAAQVGCPTDDPFNYVELNCGAVESPIAYVRDLKNDTQMAGMGGRPRVWVLDELQTWSRAKGAQEALLKILEDTPPAVYFVLCTTEPKRVIPTILNRCTKITFHPIKPADLTALVKRVAAAERLTVAADVVAAVVDAANGSARAALVELERIAGMDAADRLGAVGVAGTEAAAFDLVKTLVPFRGAASWPAVAAVLEAVADDDPEGLRQMVLACARTRLLKGGDDAARCYKVIRCLDTPFYDRNSGKALLAAACYNVIFGK